MNPAALGLNGDVYAEDLENHQITDGEMVLGASKLGWFEIRKWTIRQPGTLRKERPGGRLPRRKSGKAGEAGQWRQG